MLLEGLVAVIALITVMNAGKILAQLKVQLQTRSTPSVWVSRSSGQFLVCQLM